MCLSIMSYRIRCSPYVITGIVLIQDASFCLNDLKRTEIYTFDYVFCIYYKLKTFHLSFLHCFLACYFHNYFLLLYFLFCTFPEDFEVTGVNNVFISSNSSPSPNIVSPSSSLLTASSALVFCSADTISFGLSSIPTELLSKLFSLISSSCFSIAHFLYRILISSSSIF